MSEGNAYAIVLAVGDFSTAATKDQAIDIEEKVADEHDLRDKHANVLSILICVLIMICVLVLLHCTVSIDISWADSANISAMVFVYGFPYILTVPAIWDMALNASKRNYRKNGNIEVRNIEAIEDCASLDYLAIQAISILDNADEEQLEKHRRTIRGLQAAGIKVVLTTGLKIDEAR